MASSFSALYWLTGADEFRLDPQKVAISGLVYTDEQAIRDLLGLVPAQEPNVFRLRPAAMAESLRSLPTVASAEVEVTLPNRLAVTVHEREPLFVWQTNGGPLLVDASGTLLAGAPASGTGLPTVEDRRATGPLPAIGSRLEEVDVAAARLLLTITPADIGSASSELKLLVDDEEGWSIASQVPPWRAVFGFYTTNLRRPEELIPRQRQCLSSLLAERHEQLTVIYLAVAGDRCGSFRDQPTPTARSVQNVGRPVT